jgi:Alpha amylase, catalytic domain
MRTSNFGVAPRVATWTHRRALRKTDLALWAQRYASASLVEGGRGLPGLSRSFQNSDNDGLGDLRGITARLDCIKSLGVNVVRLNPVYQSPNDDNGYDISDYRASCAR